MTDLPSASSLDDVLDELGWRPEALARRLNTFAALHGRAERMHLKLRRRCRRSAGLVLPWTTAGSLQAVRVVTHSGSMERGIFITLLGAAASAPAHEWLLAQPEPVVARSSGSSLPMAVVD